MRFDIERASIEINGGSCFLVRCDLAFLKNVLANTAKKCYFNFPIEGSKLIVPYFEALSTLIVAKIVRNVRKNSGVKLRTSDATGMLLVGMFAELELHDTIVVGLAGLGDNSIRFCIDLVKKFLSTDPSKKVIFVSLSEGDKNLQLTIF
ncbi:MAG: hypothetical protein DI535_23160 [Citrobacter freundii]|nr:MAG: hypothetical protein DI535_23160 [Citrobacter freundii]